MRARREPPKVSTGEPHDRLTRLANEVLETLESHPEYEKGVQAIVFIDLEGRGGVGFHGYEDQRDALVNLIMHLRAIFESIGKRMEIHPINPNDPSTS